MAQVKEMTPFSCTLKLIFLDLDVDIITQHFQIIKLLMF